MIFSVLLTVLSALFYSATFPPLSLGALAWLAIAPLIVATARVTPVRAFACGVLWAVVLGLGVGGALPGMMTSYFGLPVWIGWLTLLAVSIGLAGVYVGAFAAWTSWMARRSAASPLVIAAAWGVCEFARARFWIGNPWALSGYSQIDFSPIMQIADIGGPYGIGILLAAVNAALASVFVPSLRGRRPALSAVAVVVLFAVSWSYGIWRLSQSFTTGEAISVAAVQGAIRREFRWRPEYEQLGLAEYLDLTRKAAEVHPQLVIWPEYAISFYLQERTAQRAELQRALRGLGTDLILGGPHYAFDQDDRTIYHNSIYLLRHARIAGRYDKMRLLPLAEDDALGGLVDRESMFYAAGDGPHVLHTGVGSVGAFLCFEAMYPEVVRRFAATGAEVLANLSNDDWFGSVAAARHHLAIASVRAIENRRYLIRATSTGFSAIIDAHGRIKKTTAFGIPDVLTTVVYRSTTRTFYQSWGDAVAWLALGVVLIASFTDREQLSKQRNPWRSADENRI